MNTLYVMCGIPGSGKSTVAKTIQGEIVSSDDMREKLYGDASIQGDGARVFKEVNELTKKLLAEGKNVIYDATSITAKTRKNIIKMFPGVKHVCIYVDTPVEICKQRNSNRIRVVPEEVIDRMAQKIVAPCLEEGFDEIIIKRG